MSRSIAVALCAARPPAAGVLEELVTQAGDVIVAVAGDVDLDPAVGGPGVRVVHAGAPGLSAARNAALIACADARVLALVEDDVLAESGWLNALHFAWAGAGEDVACIGGSVGVRVAGERPPWLSDELLAAFGTLEASAETATFLGANVSFRTEALRGIGGFWPSRGHPDARDLLSEEHHAQRELGRAGWSALPAPRARVTRLVDPAGMTRRDVMARRARLGAREQLVGKPREPRAAALGAMRAAVGAGVAAARRDGATAAERAARAAQLAGTLAADRLAGEDLLPTEASTPFQTSVPVPAGRTSGAADSGGAAILLYHRVLDTEHDPLGLTVACARFAEQLAMLRERFVPVTLEQLLAGEAPPRAVAVTFDDGYHDNLAHALPALREHGIPATLFVSTGHVETGRGFWWDAVVRLLRAAPEPPVSVLRIALGNDVRAWPARDGAERELALARLHDWLRSQPPERIDDALAALSDWTDHAAEGFDEDRPMTLAELRALAADDLISIGAHTRTHRSLRWASQTVQRDELARSRADLKVWLGAEPSGFSYPFGVPGADFDETTKRLTQEAGFTHALANSPGLVTAGSDRFAMPRLAVPDVDGPEFARWLRAAMV